MLPSEGSLLSPGWTVAHSSQSAHNPPSCPSTHIHKNVRKHYTTAKLKICIVSCRSNECQCESLFFPPQRGQHGWDLRSTLHLQWANIVKSTLHDVLAGRGEVHVFALEALLVIYCDLNMCNRLWEMWNLFLIQYISMITTDSPSMVLLALG